MLLYFVKSKNGKNFAFLGQYIHALVLPKISGMGLQPPSHPLNPPLVLLNSCLITY